LRVKRLEESGYIRKTNVRRTKAGFEAVIYQLNNKAYLALLLNHIDVDQLLAKISDAGAQTIMLDILQDICL
jgi:uncharacterized protein YlbG (UPF0298 family)